MDVNSYQMGLKYILYFKIIMHTAQFKTHWGFPSGSEVKRLPAMWETRVRSLGQEDPLEKEMATHSSILA